VTTYLQLDEIMQFAFIGWIEGDLVWLSMWINYFVYRLKSYLVILSRDSPNEASSNMLRARRSQVADRENTDLLQQAEGLNLRNAGSPALCKALLYLNSYGDHLYRKGDFDGAMLR